MQQERRGCHLTFGRHYFNCKTRWNEFVSRCM